jgi:hypothetical protein
MSVPAYNIRIGTPVYFDSFSGVLAAKIVGYDSKEQLFKLKITTRTPAYRAGEIVETTHLHAIPRDRIYTKKYQTLIMPYTWVNPSSDLSSTESEE